MSTVKLLYITVAEVPASVINIDTRAKGVQIAVHEIVLMTPPFFT